ncbi:MAG TPA: tRNA (adenosine(37)-N6)-threonylcarbamoyltransferase complex dimerization subunit type 1 TsaB [Anaerolineales bacterium]|nr:tRNA (adenosine(37)-N6)-threonylcarbamoyltransferase complex dimerization subunit type 1 TsaB [Anaerolineales bacterium]
MLLALDTSTRSIGLALYDGVQVLCESIWNSKDYHTVELAPEVMNALDKAGVKVSDLTALAVAIGPGSFTGLRIGLAFAKGLALAQRLPLVGVGTMDILAACQPVQEIPLAVVLQAGRGRLAVGWYQAVDNDWHPQGEPEILAAEELHDRINKPTLVCGELSEPEQRLLSRKRVNVLLASPARSVRRPAVLAEIGWMRWQAGQSDPADALAPIYLHTHEAIPG